MPLERLQNLFQRLSAYSPLEMILELAVIWIVVYLAIRFVQGTRAAGALKGMLLVLLLGTLLARVIGGGETLPRLTFLYDRFLAIVAIGLVVIFQPELRRALVRLGEAPFFRSTPSDIARVVDALIEASSYLSRNRFGAIVVIERQTGLQGLIEGGTLMNAEVSARLLQTIFFPGSALHDLAVLIRGRRITAAGVQLPLAEPADMPDPQLGARHRAAVGLSRECDALVLTISEETGTIRLAERGRLSGALTPDELRAELRSRLERIPPARDRDDDLDDLDTHKDEKR